MSLLDEIVANIESIVCKDELKKYLFRNVCFVNDEDMYGTTSRKRTHKIDKF